MRSSGGRVFPSSPRPKCHLQVQDQVQDPGGHYRREIQMPQLPTHAFLRGGKTQALQA